MEIITSRQAGMFPAPAEISMDCSCPDWATMCKHVAAAVYGVGARLDEQPELFFKLRQVDHLELIEQAGKVEAITRRRAGGKKTIAAGELAEVFGVEMESPASEQSAPAVKNPQPSRKRKPKAASSEPAAGLRKRGAGSAAKARPVSARSRKPRPSPGG
jgi:uncharacterized Zn finger protein